MATKKKHILYDLEVPPPPEVWPQLEARLNREYHAEEVPVAQKMYDMEFMPPASAWENIAAELPQQPAKKPARVIAFARMMTAAAAMVLITLAAWYFLDNSSNKINGSVAKHTTTHTTSAANAQQPSATTNATASAQPQATASATDEETPTASHYANRGRYQPSKRWFAYDDEPVVGPNDARTVSYASSGRETTNARMLIGAKRPIITNKTSPDDCYMDVTSPNGEQTRVSSKFMQAIGSLNDDDAPDDYFDFLLQDNNSEWKSRIREWKNKFLNQSSFIPTATSFSDILELRDLLQQDNNPNQD